MSTDIGIDLGTANIMITMGNKGIVLNEPSVVAYNKKMDEVVAVGEEAYRMIGRTPEYIIAVRPLRDGVISDHNMTQSMIKAFILKVSKKNLIMPRITLCVPSFITDVESRAVIEAALSAGARRVYLIDEPIAAMLGAGIDISKAEGNMVVDIGGGTADVAVVSLSGVVVSDSIKVAGNKLDQDIIKYISSTYQILIGEKMAEKAKKEIANVFHPIGDRKITIKGRHLIKGLPQAIEISDLDIYAAVKEHIESIIDTVKGVLEKTPPELAGDIIRNGITLTGGGALLGGFDKLIEQETGIATRVADDPLACVAKGTGMSFSMIDTLRDGFEAVSMYK